MTSDTDSSLDSSDSSSVKHKLKKHKSHRKSKKHSEKKSKKHKKEKKHKIKKKRRHSSSSSGEEEGKPVSIAPKAIAPPRNEEDLEEDAFGPALPPTLLAKSPNSATSMIGPVLPANLESSPVAEEAQKAEGDSGEDEDDDMGSFGPMPTSEHSMTEAQRKLEERALELKLAGLGGSKDATDDTAGREEWMLELPDVGLKGGLAALSNMKRTFHHGKERPDFSDRSGWTQTPNDGGKKKKPPTAETMQQKAQANYERERDKQQEKLAKKHKREAPLVEQHQKKLRKEQRKKEKELLASGGKAERRPFSRDVDLKLNKIDKNQTKQIVDKAKILDSKFSSGHTKFL